MTTSSKADTDNLTSLAQEACDLWQEHLASYAQNPDAKAAMMRMIEPQRQLFASMFADYTSMMQNAQHGAANPSSANSSRGTASTSAHPTGAAAPHAAPDDLALRLAQLAHRVAQLEQHNAELEGRLAGLEQPANPDRNASSAKTARPAKQD